MAQRQQTIGIAISLETPHRHVFRQSFELRQSRRVEAVGAGRIKDRLRQTLLPAGAAGHAVEPRGCATLAGLAFASGRC